MLSRARSYGGLTWWLGPWADAQRAPGAVARTDVVLKRPDAEGAVRLWCFRPRLGRPAGVYVLAPGLHFAGPADPRMERFARVLAASGFVVVAPFIEDYMRLRVTPRAITDFRLALRWVLDGGVGPLQGPPAVFSISFGSMLALKAAADPELGPRVGGLRIFGGFADWQRTVRFALSGRVEDVIVERDRLNTPAVFLNYLPHLPQAPHDAAALEQAWMHFVRMTWGRAELKHGEASVPIAERLATTVTPEDRELFLIGCGARPGAEELFEQAHARAGDAFDFISVGADLRALSCPVAVIHGAADDVIPVTEARHFERVLAGRVPTEIFVTGLYGHTDAGGAASLGALARELRTMAAMVGVIGAPPVASLRRDALLVRRSPAG